jgi:ABC-2 type transport system permease protein
MITAELLKLRSVASTWVALAVAAVGLLLTQVLTVTLLPALASGAVLGDEPEIAGELEAVDTGSAAFQDGALDVLGTNGATGSIGIVTIAVLALGVLAGTTDFRHGGIVGTALARPRRTAILVGKGVATAMTAALLGVVLAAVALTVLLVSVWSGAGGLELQPSEIASALGRGLLVVVLLSLVGLSIGLIVRGQLGAFIAVAVLLVGEPIVQGLAQLATGAQPVWAQLLPGALARAALADPSVSASLPPLVALGLLAVLTVAALAVAGTVLRRRDL